MIGNGDVKITLLTSRVRWRLRRTASPALRSSCGGFGRQRTTHAPKPTLCGLRHHVVPHPKEAAEAPEYAAATGAPNPQVGSYTQRPMELVLGILARFVAVPRRSLATQLVRNVISLPPALSFANARASADLCPSTPSSGRPLVAFARLL